MVISNKVNGKLINSIISNRRAINFGIVIFEKTAQIEVYFNKNQSVGISKIVIKEENKPDTYEEKTIFQLLDLQDDDFGVNDPNVIYSYYRMEINPNQSDINMFKISNIGTPSHPTLFGSHLCDNQVADYLYLKNGVGCTATNVIAQNGHEPLQIQLDQPACKSGKLVITTTLFFFYVPSRNQ